MIVSAHDPNNKIKKTHAAKWGIFIYKMGDDGKCQMQQFESKKDALKTFNESSQNQTMIAVTNGNVIKTKGSDQILVEQCMGTALFDGNLKRKSF